MSSEREFLIANGMFSEGWDDLPPVFGSLVNQQPKGWRLRWLEPGETLWDSGDTAQGVPECVHKHTDQLPINEQPGQPEALILAGAFVYKIFHAGAPFGAELRQPVVGLPPGAQVTVRAPVLIDGHGETDIFGAEAGLWANGEGAWRNFGEHGHRKWYTHTQTVTVPASGVVEVVIRVKSKWAAPKDFFIDDVRMEVTAAPEIVAAGAPGEAGGVKPLVDIDRIRLGLDPWDGFPLIPPNADETATAATTTETAGGDADTTATEETAAVTDSGVLVNGSFEAGWNDMPPAPGNLVNQQPTGWRLTWLEPGQTLWGSSDTAQGVPECVHKHVDQLPVEEHPGQPGALILDGEWVYKIFHFGSAFGAELAQTVAGLKPGTTATVQAPVLIDGHGETDIFGAEAGLWVNGEGAWRNLEQHGSRKWHIHTQTVTVPGTGVVEIVLRVKSKWPAPKDFFIDDLRLEAVRTDITPPVEPPTEPFEGEHVLTPTDFDLKVRSGPGLEHEIRDRVNPGDRLIVIEDWDAARAKVGVHGQWINVRSPGGIEGWSAAWIVDFVGEPPPVVVTELYPPPMQNFTFTNDFHGPDGHKGWDFAASVGEAVFSAPNGGRVFRAMRCSKCTDDRPSVTDHNIPLNDSGVLNDPDWGWGFGHHAIVRYRNEDLPEATRQALADQGMAGWHLYCMYAHLSTLDVSQGDDLDGQTRIGACGNTGNSSAAHLHLEVRAGSDPDKMGAWLLLALLNPDIAFRKSR